MTESHIQQLLRRAVQTGSSRAVAHFIPGTTST